MKIIEDAIRLSNSSVYGLTAAIYTRKKEEIETFIESIESGVVYVNRALSATTGAMVGCQSFAGWKGSGTTGIVRWRVLLLNTVYARTEPNLR